MFYSFVLINNYALIQNDHPKNKPKRLYLKPLPNNLSPTVYSSLIGLLASSGASIDKGPNWWWFPNSVLLKLSSTNISFLRFMAEYFHGPFDFSGNLPYTHSIGSKSISVISNTSNLCVNIWAHWNREGIKFLPRHFEEYFSWHTLAFWRIRNGQLNKNRFILGISRLAETDKIRLINVLNDKLNLKSNLTINGKKLSIQEPELIVKNIKPIFHRSQISRIEEIH